MAKDFFDTAEKALNQEGSGDTCWANFGYWAQAQTYPQAGQALAQLLADAAGLQSGHALLDLGFGMGEQLRFWQQRYAVTDLLGVNPSASQLAVARSRLPADTRYELHCAGVQDLPQLLPGRRFQRVLALDCAYHFPRREALLRRLRQQIDADGRLAWTGLYLPDQPATASQRIARRAVCAASRIVPANLHTLQDLQACLQRQGWQLEQHRNITQQVWPPFAAWWRYYRQNYRVPRRARLKFDLTASVVERAAQQQLFQYGLFVARPALGAASKK